MKTFLGAWRNHTLAASEVKRRCRGSIVRVLVYASQTTAEVDMRRPQEFGGRCQASGRHMGSYEERAAIQEDDGGLTRDQNEAAARAAHPDKAW
jgi:hypothetical protein